MNCATCWQCSETTFSYFDRASHLPDTPETDPAIRWNRWKRNVIDRQVGTAHGAERYIRSGRQIFLDPKGEIPFPLNIDRGHMTVHKIIVAHGAKEACQNFSEDNVYGSLGISYSDGDGELPFPFMVHVDKSKPLHIFDSHNLPIIFWELDTVSDFTAYLDAKIEAIGKFDLLSYCGDEDLLAHYLLNFDKQNNRHFIGPLEPNFNGAMVGEGEWRDFVTQGFYKTTKKAAEISYIWDDLIQRTCQNSLDGKLLGNADLLQGKSAIYEMAKEPRYYRRALSERIVRAINDFPNNPGQLVRHISFFPSRVGGNGYVFLQLKPDPTVRADPEYRQIRQSLLEIACGGVAPKGWPRRAVAVV